MNADIWISALEDLIVILAVLHVVIAAVLGWVLSVIARLPIWLGIVLCILLPVVGFLIMAVTALVRQISRARASTAPRTPGPRAAVRVGLALAPAVALLLLCATLVLPWFRIPLDNGFRLKVAGSVIGAETAVLISAALLSCAIILSACFQPLWSGMVQTLNAGFWSVVSAIVLILLGPVQALLRDYAKTSMTVDEGLNTAGIDETGAPTIPQLPIPEPIGDFFPFLPKSPIDIGGIDLAHYLPRFGIQLGISWWFVFAAIALTIGFSVWSAVRGTLAARGGARQRPGPRLGQSGVATAPGAEAPTLSEQSNPAVIEPGAFVVQWPDTAVAVEPSLIGEHPFAPPVTASTPPVPSSTPPDSDDPWKDVI